MKESKLLKSGILLLSVLGLAFATLHAQEKPEALKINTAGWTDSPFMTLDGRYLYFMYTPYNFFPWLLQTGDIEKRGPDRSGHHANPDHNPWGDSDIYRVERLADGSWGEPENLPFNDDGADACPMLTADGRTVYWQKDIGGNADLYVAYLDEDGVWSEAQALDLSINAPDSHETNPHISSDGQTLYFTSDRAGGYGGNDLYVARLLEDGSWSEPENLGRIINTADDEDQIWISEDGQTAYFNRGLVILMMQWQETDWSLPEVVQFEDEVVLAAEVSLTADGQVMVLAVPDIAEQRLIIAESRLLPDGRWNTPQPLD